MSDKTKISGTTVFSTEVLWQKSKDLLRVEHLLAKEELRARYAGLHLYYQEEVKRVGDYIISLSFPKKYDSEALKFSILAQVLCDRHNPINVDRDPKLLDAEISVMRNAWLDRHIRYVKDMFDNYKSNNLPMDDEFLKNYISLAHDLVGLTPAIDEERKARAFNLWQELESKANVGV
ncbi:MAG: hypothetical protein WCO30_00155 [bacterium]